MAKASQGAGAERGLEGASCGVPGTPWAPEYPPSTYHRVPLPVPIDATEAQDREQGQRGEH